MSYVSEVTADAPVNWLRLNEASGNATDSGSAGGTATVGASGITRSVTGVDSTAYTFSGATAANITRTKAATFLTSTYTVEVWVKTSTSGAKTIAGYNIGGRGFTLGVNASNKPYYSTSNNNGTYTVTSTGPAINDNQWHHIVAVWNGATIKIYVDGLVTINTSAVSGTYGQTATLDVGTGNTGTGFIGTIDEFALYTGELSATRIGVHLREGFANDYQSNVKSDTPISYWRMETTSAYNEITGTNNTLTGTISTQGGKPNLGTAWSFNGSQAINLNGTYTDFTSDNIWSIEAWFKKGTSSGTQSWPTIWRRDGNGKAILLRLQDNADSDRPGKLRLYLNGTDFYSSARYDDDQWHHAVVTANGTGANGLKVYVDGTEIISGTSPNIGVMAAGTQTMAIGSGNGNLSTGESWYGGLDEVAVYDYALSSTRVAAHYAAGAAVNVSFPAEPAYVSAVTVPMPAARIDDGYVAQASAITASMPMPTIVTQRSITVSAEAMAVGVTLADDTLVTDKTAHPLTTWAQTISLSGYESFNDNTQTNDMPTATASSAIKAWVKPTLQLPGDAEIGSCTLDITYLMPANSFNTSFTFYSIDEDFDPTTVTASTEPDSGAITGPTVNTPGTGINSTFANATVDLSEIIKAIWAGTAYGFKIVGASSTQNLISTPDASPDDRDPVLTVNYNGSGDWDVAAQPMNVTVGAVDPTVTVTTQVTVAVDAMATTISMVQPVIDATRSVSLPVEAMSLSVTMQNATAYIPDAVVSAAPMNVTLDMPDDYQVFAGTDAVNAVESMTISISVEEVGFENQTDRVIGVEPMSIRTLFVGIYDVEDDPYYANVQERLTAPYAVSTMVEPAKRFYDFRGGTNPYPGEILGTPEFNTPGYRGRKGMLLDGDDYIDVPAYGDQFLSYRTFYSGIGGVEFGIKTTQTNGVLLSTVGNVLNLEIDNGYITVVNGPNVRIQTPVQINDGEWHHIVWFPEAGQRATLMVDGQVRWSRINSFASFFPGVKRFGRRVTDTHTQGTMQAKPGLVGELVDPIPWMSYFSRDTFKQAYYAWSETKVVNAEIMEGPVVSMPDAKGRGNKPRMLLLYGLSTSRDANGNMYNAYRSPTSGIQMDNPGGSPHQLGRNLFGQPQSINAPNPFDYEGYRVFPVHMILPANSAPGIVERELSVEGDYEDYYLNDEGQITFVDLENDLAEPASEFDVIHVLNWPDENLDVAGQYNQGTENPPFYESDGVMTEGYYDAMREKFSNQLLDAAEGGASLWISDPRMAIDLGFATGYDQHTTPLANDGTVYWGMFDPKSEQRDRELAPSFSKGGPTPDGTHGGTGYYEDHYSVHMRRVVATETNFSEAPSWYVTEAIGYHDNDRFKAQSDVYAHNVDRLTEGLLIGTQFPLTTRMGFEYTLNTNRPVPRTVTSLKTAGLVGKVIAKEQLTYFDKLNVVSNPYSDNAVTVLVPEGTVHRGRTLTGRVFMEMMDNGDYIYPTRHTAESKLIWGGAPVNTGPVSNETEIVKWSQTEVAIAGPNIEPYIAGTIIRKGEQQDVYLIQKPKGSFWDGANWISSGASNWDLDTRRARETFTYTQQQVLRAAPGSDATIVTGSYYTVEIPTLTIDEAGLETEELQFRSMNSRGLFWMNQLSDVNEGDEVIAVPAMEVTVDGTPNEVVRINKSTTVTAEAMRGTVTLVTPDNVEQPDVTILADRMEVSVKMNMTAKVVRVEPITWNVEFLDAVYEKRTDEDFVLYVKDYNMTLYLGDN